MVEPGRPQMTIKYSAEKMRLGFRTAKTSIQIHGRNIYCFPTATVVTRTRLNVALYVQCQSCLILKGLVTEFSRECR
jgi:hypothetical protein